MAIIFNPNLHHTFINDIPIKIVTEFLIKKGVVNDKEQCLGLYRATYVNTGQLSMSKQDFIKIFTRFMFISSLIKVANIIDKTGGST